MGSGAGLAGTVDASVGWAEHSEARHHAQDRRNRFGVLGFAVLSPAYNRLISVPDTRVVIGSTKIERIRDAVHVCDEPLPRDARYALWEAARGSPAP